MIASGIATSIFRVCVKRRRFLLRALPEGRAPKKATGGNVVPPPRPWGLRRGNQALRTGERGQKIQARGKTCESGAARGVTGNGQRAAYAAGVGPRRPWPQSAACKKALYAAGGGNAQGLVPQWSRISSSNGNIFPLRQPRMPLWQPMVVEAGVFSMKGRRNAALFP